MVCFYFLVFCCVSNENSENMLMVLNIGAYLNKSLGEKSTVRVYFCLFQSIKTCGFIFCSYLKQTPGGTDCSGKVTSTGFVKSFNQLEKRFSGFFIKVSCYLSPVCISVCFP